MNNNGDGKIPMIGQEKRDKWKKILPELLAVAAVVILHHWKGNVLLSIAGGTALYMLLVQVVFA